MSFIVNKKDPVRRRYSMFVKSAFAIISVPVILIALVEYINWSAEREAQAFCDAIEPGSDISLAVTKFEEKLGKRGALHYGSVEDKGHTFLFPGFMFDKAVCGVSVASDGKAISKYSQMQYD